MSELKALEASNPGGLKPREKKQLEDLERDVSRVKKARNTLGVKDRTRARGDRENGNYESGGGRKDGTMLGKRSRGWDKENESSDTDPEVRNIPMPRDTPPPIPRPRHKDFASRHRNANLEPLGDNVRVPHGLPSRPDGTMSPPTTTSSTPQIRTTYEAAPQIKDLQKEAIKIVPNVVRRKMAVSQGQGGGGRLVEEEEMAKLESEGYGTRNARRPEGEGGVRHTHGGDVATDQSLAEAGKVAASLTVEPAGQATSLEEEEARFAREVQMEEITDEDA